MNCFDPVTLRLFVAVCEEGNIARAAVREAIVASAISKRIATLEDELAVPLLVRGRRGIVPTAAGDALLRQARELLGSMGRLRAELSEFASGVHGSVRVLASISVLSELLPDDLAGFLGRYQSVRISLEERVSSEIVRSVREGSADFGVLWDAGNLDGLHTVPYRDDHLCVLARPGHPLTARRQLRFEDCLDHETVGVIPGSIVETMLRRYAALAGRSWANRIQVSTLDAACRIVAAGLGVAVLPREATEPHAQALQLAVLPLQDDWAHRRFVICMRSSEGLTATARLLVDHLQRQAASTAASATASATASTTAA
jgi:DNA-binding transcriptional LysR family regulator